MSSAHISMITLGVADIARSTAFYEALGWRKAGPSDDSVSFLKGGTVVLGLYGRAALAEDAAVEDEPTGFAAVTLAANLPSEADVDRFYEQALAAGASARKPPEKVFWGGYSGYFADPDGHLWEVAHNPFFPLDENGAVQLPEAGQ
jgi:catechol 2,3-dioxygenase-like lactoylglutathione lyase family enzyme